MSDEIVIVGGGICGLSLALNLHARGIPCRVYERAPEVKELGVGITLLPHAMRELAALGLQEEIARAGIENRESCFFNRFGQLIYREARGKFAGYQFPEIGIHRGRLHLILYQAALARLGADRIRTNQIACDGVNSAVRRQFYPGERVAFIGINTWRGVTRHKPILTGRSYLRVGSILTGKIVIYPIIDDVDGEGNQLVNWTTEIKQDTFEKNDWNQPGNLGDFFHLYRDWHFDWLDVAELIRKSEQIFEYPMVDKDPVGRWTFGRVTFAGDAAHPMYPRGSNGAAQAVIDTRTLADMLQQHADRRAALAAYEAARREVTARIVRTNREHPPDFINIKVEELVGDRPFENLEDYITQDELRALSEQYKRIAGFAVSDVRRA